MSTRTLYAIVANASRPVSDEELNDLIKGTIDIEFPVAYNNESSAWYWANEINDILDQTGTDVRVTVRPVQEYAPITKQTLDRKARSLFP
jgi:hypothetical protein